MMNFWNLFARIRRCGIEVIEDIEKLLSRWEKKHRHHHHHHHHRARLLELKFTVGQFTTQGENMTFTMPPLNAAGNPSAVSVVGAPVQADGVTPSNATLSAVSYTSSDSTVFTVAPDPNVLNGAIITAVGTPAPGTTVSATLTETATATEPDGTTTEQISGVATIVLAAPAAVPPPAAALVFTFGTPQ